MIRFLIFSDTHGRRGKMEEIVANHPEAQYVIHLGDCVNDVKSLTDINSEITLYNVRGNCDSAFLAEEDGEIVVSGKRIFFTHGHKYSVKSGLERLIFEGQRRQADVVFFGHTHSPRNHYLDGMYIFNPGSLSRPREGRATYGIMDIYNGQISLNIAEV